MDLSVLAQITEVVQAATFTDIAISVSLIAGWGILASIKKELGRIVAAYGDRYKMQARRFTDLMDLNTVVLQKLEDLLHDIGCDRVLIIQYHNGEHSLNGVDFARMSCTHEVVDKSSKPNVKQNMRVQSRLLGIPVTAYQSLTRRIIEEKVVIIEDVETIKHTNPSTYAELKFHRAKSIVLVRLTDLQNNIVGFMLAEYCTARLNQRPHVASKMLEVGAKISTLLESAGTFFENEEAGKHKDG